MIYKFEQLFKWQSGKAITVTKGSIPVYGSNGIIGYTDKSKYKNKIILGRVGAYCGTVEYCKNDFNATDNTLITECNEKVITYQYAYYLLKLYNLNKYAGGSAQPLITQGILKHLRCDIPNIEYQNEITKVLIKYDDLIRKNNKRIKILEQTAEEIYKEWFIRFRFPRYEESEFYEGIPKGWKVKRLKDFGNIETGRTPSTEIIDNYGDHIMFIKTPDMHNNIFVINSEERLSEKGNKAQIKKKLPANSIMVSCIGTGGVVAINAEEAHTNQQINSIKLYNNFELEWLYFTCKLLKPTIEMFGATGATMTNLSKGKFEKLKVIKPKKDIIKKFSNIVYPLFDEIKKLMYKNENLIKQRELLLPRLMSGKLEIK